MTMAALVVLALGGCVPATTPSASGSASPASAPVATDTPQASASAASSPTASAVATAGATPSPTAEPSLSLELPPTSDARVVAVSVSVEVPADADGRILVTVTSDSDELIDELVLRWPTDLNAALFLAPFVPSADRIVEGGPPLSQPWTKWVIGPGEQDEPAGTTSLGWGPLLAGGTLEIPIIVSRIAAGPVAFDLQVLARNDILTLADGRPAEIRVEVP